MSDRGEHVRLFATFLNTAASGSLLGVIVTLSAGRVQFGPHQPFPTDEPGTNFCRSRGLVGWRSAIHALEIRMTLVPTILAPLLVLLVAVGGVLIFYFTGPRAKREPIDPRRKVGEKPFAKLPTRARRKVL